MSYLNDEQEGLKSSLRISGDIERQGNMIYEELEDQKGLLSVFFLLFNF